ncbi:hypothetical protein K505DRAFT_114646 [Melanomma pulvis-pyrius CBS 109.77]|uniref:Uncharacterized protein n=1 Tax=Melanomma pulvis-pyrius CBS 109.77 TaxID=1314802 RepID=A0A6A6XPH0_9PLEO|nr:hypothetical protein K505DRAFT_114646 [Melanomma pulvis-pyrius CBS 109.77]
MGAHGLHRSPALYSPTFSYVTIPRTICRRCRGPVGTQTMPRPTLQFTPPGDLSMSLGIIIVLGGYLIALFCFFCSFTFTCFFSFLHRLRRCRCLGLGLEAGLFLRRRQACMRAS